MKKILSILILFLSIIISCKKETKSPDSEAPTSTNTSTTTTPTVTPSNYSKIINRNWTVYNFDNSGGINYYSTTDIGDIYQFLTGSTIKFYINEGTTKNYASDPSPLMGNYWAISGSTLEFTHNGYALEPSNPFNPSLILQFNIIKCKNDTLVIKRQGTTSYLYFHVTP